MSIHANESWKSINDVRLKRNAQLMYQMLKKIADEKEPWCVEDVRGLLRLVAHASYAPNS